MAVSVRDARESRADLQWLQQVYRDYLDDLAPVSGGTGLFPALGEIGHREPDQVARWFGDPNALPMVILESAEPVGFAMVTRARPGALRSQADYRMAEFFVERRHRRRGIGALAVQIILSRFAGRWEITEYLRNAGAVAFWRRVVAAYTRGNYQERIVNGEVRQWFDSAVRTPRNPP